MRSALLLPLALLVSLAAACSKDAPPAPPPTGPSPYGLAADPGVGIAVTKARAGPATDSVVVEGRVKDMTAGFAAFTLMDTGLKYCGEVKEEGADMEHCPHPWDYCCYPPAKRRENLIRVEVRGKDGNVVAIERLPELRNLDLIVVKGSLVKEADGEFVLVATGWFRRARPTLAEGLEFPQ